MNQREAPSIRRRGRLFGHIEGQGIEAVLDDLRPRIRFRPAITLAEDFSCEGRTEGRRRGPARDAPLCEQPRTAHARVRGKPCAVDLLDHWIPKICHPGDSCQAVQGRADQVCGGERIRGPDDGRTMPANHPQSGQHGGRQPAGPAVRKRQKLGIAPSEAQAPCIERVGALDDDAVGQDAGGDRRGLFVGLGVRAQNERLPARVAEITHQRQRPMQTAARAHGREVKSDQECAFVVAHQSSSTASGVAADLDAEPGPQAQWRILVHAGETFRRLRHAAPSIFPSRRPPCNIADPRNPQNA